ncbi:MAG: PIG-L deacetylase family protein [Anaerolineae bacterium]
MRVMAFGAHPDDIEFYCAGTLAKYRAAGHEVAIVVMTNGEVGSPTLSKEEIAAVREGEARCAADVIGATFFWMGYPDEFLFNTPEVRLHVIDTIRRFQPDILITLDKDHDYHPDHTATGQVVWDTHVMVTVPNIRTDSPPCARIPEIYYMDTAAGINFLPEFYVDITAVWDQKSAMLRCHESQELWLRNQYGTTLVENAEIQSRFRGYQTACKYAEAFRKPRFFPEATAPDALLPSAVR